jgi:hypothetical protein
MLIMVAFGSWGLAHRSGEPELRIRAELLRDGGPELSEQFMEELRETHLGTTRRRPEQATASERLQRAPTNNLPEATDPTGHVNVPSGRPRLEAGRCRPNTKIVPLEKSRSGNPNGTSAREVVRSATPDG